MARGLTDYLNDWNIPEQSGDARKNASGADSDGDSPDYNVPYRSPSPVTPEWNDDGKGGGYGHSDSVKETQDYKAWGMSKDDVAQGYERPGSGGAGEPGTASYPQAIPSTNEYDRGSGSAARNREFSEEGRGFDGRGNDKPSPGREAMGSSKLVG